MLHNILDWRSFGLFLCQHTAQKVFAVIAYWAPNGFGERDLGCQNFMGCLSTVFPWKGDPRANKSVEHDTKGPYVGLKVTRLVSNDFWGHKADCASNFLDGFSLLKLCSHSEVCNLDFRNVSSIADKNVEVLEITMGDTIRVAFLYSFNELFEEHASLIFG